MSIIKYVLGSSAIVLSSIIILSILGNLSSYTKRATFKDVVNVYNALCKFKDITLNYKVNLFCRKTYIKIGEVLIEAYRVDIIFPLDFSLPYNGSFKGKPFSINERGITSWIVINDDGKTLILKYFYSRNISSYYISFKEEVDRSIKGAMKADVFFDNYKVYSFEGYREIIIIRVYLTDRKP